MKTSAGILLYRNTNELPEVFLVHPGGPFWKNKDLGAWSIPKGEYALGENPLDCAKREFEEETGQAIEGYFIPLDAIKQSGGKTVYAWAVEGNIDAEKIVSNTIMIPWPPKSGKLLEIPEVDRGAWFVFDEAKFKIIPAQAAFIVQLQDLLSSK
ncbi:MAG: NUDIX domain-containing protein [Chitinophagaceae bacterium]|nr:MAG: NUDIX domain-containing protein [Chitinophagaceae bacterium]